MNFDRFPHGMNSHKVTCRAEEKIQMNLQRYKIFIENIELCLLSDVTLYV